MKTLTNFFQYTWFAALLLAILMLMPVASLATMSQLDRDKAEIARQDIAIEKIALERSAVRKELNKLKQFSKGADVWFSRLSAVNAKIRAAEQQKNGGYATYDTRQENELQRLYRERNQLERLNGGSTISGIRYNSMDQLRNALKTKGKEAITLNKEYLKMSEKLREKDQKRDNFSAKLEDAERIRLEGNQRRLQWLQEDRQEFLDLANDNNTWCLMGYSVGLAPPFISRGMAINILTQRYLAKIQTTPGMKYDPKELSRQIKELRDQSNTIKNYIRNDLIPETDQEINALRKEIQKAQQSVADLSGCWVIFVGNTNYPTVNIKKNGDGDYEGFITNVGQLDYIRRGDRLFSVAPINKNTFDGTEYSYTEKGKPTRIRLRLILSQDGNGLSYRSDQVLNMRRCQ